MSATQTVKVTKKTKTTTVKRGLAALPSGGSNKAGRPKGSKDSKPRKTRSDKGKSRSPYKKRNKNVTSA